MTEEARATLYFVSFLILIVLLVWLAIAVRRALDLTERTSARNRLMHGASVMGLAALLMYVSVQPGTLLEREVRIWLFLGALWMMSAGTALKIYGWWALREGLLRQRARERMQDGST